MASEYLTKITIGNSNIKLFQTFCFLSFLRETLLFLFSTTSIKLSHFFHPLPTFHFLPHNFPFSCPFSLPGWMGRLSCSCIWKRLRCQMTRLSPAVISSTKKNRNPFQEDPSLIANEYKKKPRDNDMSIKYQWNMLMLTIYPDICLLGITSQLLSTRKMHHEQYISLCHLSLIPCSCSAKLPTWFILYF